MAASFKTEKWIQKLQRDLTGEERRELKQQIEADKRIRDAILLMQGDVIVDGHNRYEIAVELGLDCPSTIINFANPKQEVPLWIYRNQVGRRNLTPQEYKLCIGRLYNAVKAPVGKPPANLAESAKLKSSAEHAAEIAAESGVSERTVRQAAKTAELVDELSDQLQTAYKNNAVKLTEPQLKVLASMPKTDQNVAFNRVRTGGQQWDQVLPKKPKAKEKPAKKEKPKAEQIAERAKALGKTLDNFLPVVDQWTNDEGLKKSDYNQWNKKHWGPAVEAFKKLIWKTK